MSVDAAGHDVVVIGASAGGVEALRSLVGALPADFAASVFVVLHVPPDTPSGLAMILDRAAPLPATQVTSPEPIRRGHIYVAPPNLHLMVRRGMVVTDAGPRENRSRPSVDVLFRSASRAYRQRVVGVVLSGTLGDGALGLAAIKLRGGVTIVQDPAEALFPGMPEKALTTARIDYCLGAVDIARQLVQLTEHHLVGGAMETSDLTSEPTEHAADEPLDQPSPKQPNAASGLTCPECHGSLWEVETGDDVRYECRIGHAYGVDALLSEQGEAVEAAFWAAINSLQERAATFRRLSSAQSSPSSGTSGYAERAEHTERQALMLHDVLRRLVTEGLVG